MSDLRYAVRNLLRAPAFTMISIVSLALGVGATTVIFSVVNALLLRPPAEVEAPERLVSVYTSDFSGPRYGTSSYPDLLDFAGSDALADVAGFTVDFKTLSREGPGVTLFTEVVTGNYFRVLGVRPILGRFFDPAETQPGAAEALVVIGEGLWEREFGRDPAVIGRTVQLDAEPFVVIGVAPGDFVSSIGLIAPDLWLPVTTQGETGDARGSRGLFLRARLRPNATVDQAQAQLAVIAARLHREYPDTWTDVKEEARVVTVVPEVEARVPPQFRGALVGVLSLLMIIVSLVLALACSNVANLLLTRASRRRREIAVRLAIGAGRGRLIRQLLTEAVVLAVAGGVVGVFLTTLVTGYFASGRIPLPVQVRVDFGLDIRVLLFAVVASVGTGVLFGLVPALQASNPNLVATLKGEAGEGGVRLRRLGFKNVFVVVQITGAMVLLVGTGLFLRSLQAAQTVDLGLDPDGVAVFTVDLPEGRYSEETGRQFYRRILERVEQLPGVDGVALGASIPLTGGGSRRSVGVKGYEPAPGEDMEFFFNVVGAGYFRMARIPILQGREFRESDTETAPPVVIVNEAFAERFWPGENPIGRQIALSGSRTADVVGLARDGKYRTLTEEPQLHFWMPFEQNYRGRVYVHVRTSGEPRRIFPSLIREVGALDRALPVLSPTTMRSMTDTATFAQRLVATVLGFAGGLALFLAAIGIYGVMAYAVSQRTHEVGIRVALGAMPQHVVRLVVRDGLVLAGIGMAVGLLIVFGVTRLLSALLFGVDPMDPLSLGIAVLVLGSVAILASLVPALRAARVDPVDAFRHE